MLDSESMEISFFTHHGNLQTQNGYGAASWGIVTSLQKLGHTVPFDSAQSPVQLNFCQPSYFADSLIDRNQHKIGYTAWESTEVPEDWPEIFEECDEVWATSEWVAKWYRNQGINCTKVFNHGIDPIWKPKLRELDNGPLTFMHHGEPAPRKGGQLAYDAFIAAFGKNNNSVHLILKGAGHSTVRTRKNGTLVNLPKNVTVASKMMEDKALRDYYHLANVMVYPSYGEGFGFIPLQALATGMPTICTGEWADYKKYLGDLSLESTYRPSKWQHMHPGNVCEPDFDDLVEKYRYAFENYETLSPRFHKQSFAIHKEYDWVTLTQKAFEEIVPKNLVIASEASPW